MSVRTRAAVRSPLPSMQSEISILNAESYSDLPSHESMRMASKSHQDARLTSKRAAPLDRQDGADDDDDEAVRKKRSRGRPRLDTKDENAADRRRTQIRLAQRAYRHRKDTAITTLEQRVKELETANETMSKEFSKFYDIILADGVLDIVPHTAPALRAIAEKLLRLASASSGNAGPSSENDEPNAAEPANRRRTIDSTSEVGTQLSAANAGSQTSIVADPEGLNASSSFVSSLPGAHQHPGQLSFEVVAQATPNNASFPLFNPMESTTPQQSSPFRHSMPAPYPRIPSPSSYAFNERTFGRRLQRTTLESGLKLASMANPPPDRYARVFGFCLLFEPRESIIRRLAAGLRKASNQSLDTWKEPISSLANDQYNFLEHTFGSSGSDSFNQALLPLGKSSDIMGFPTVPPFGPQAQISHDDKVEQRIRMICQNFEGEFFTSDEVELFLRRLGINIPQHAEFVEAEIDLSDLGGVDTVNISVPPSDAQHQFGGITLPQPNSSFSSMLPPSGSNQSIYSWPTTTSTTASFESTPMTSQATNSSLYSRGVDHGSVSSFMNSQDFGQIWSTAAPQWSKTKVTVDVRLLIQEMVSKSVCLGRTPGVRPKDVITAVKRATGLATTNG